MAFDIQQFNPMRSPQWRLERAVKLADHKPRPLKARRSDDYYVQAYRRFVLAMKKADGNSEKEHEVFLNYPEVFYCHAARFHQDREWHALIQAWILTGESDAVIAKKLGTFSGVVNYYEKIFYNVRDRRECSAWMIKTIMGPISARVANKNDSMTDDQRFYLWRLFAFYGGPHILEAVVSGMTQKTALYSSDDIQEWFQGTLTGLIKIRATMAARVFETSKWNVMQLMELGVNLIKAQEEAGGTQSDTDRRIAELLTSVHWGITGSTPEMSPDPLRLTSPVEPRAMESIALANNHMPQSLLSAEAAVNHARLGDKPEEPIIVEAGTV